MKEENAGTITDWIHMGADVHTIVNIVMQRAFLSLEVYGIQRIHLWQMWKR